MPASCALQLCIGDSQTQWFLHFRVARSRGRLSPPHSPVRPSQGRRCRHPAHSNFALVTCKPSGSLHFRVARSHGRLSPPHSPTLPSQGRWSRHPAHSNFALAAKATLWSDPGVCYHLNSFLERHPCLRPLGPPQGACHKPAPGHTDRPCGIVSTELSRSYSSRCA